MSVTRPGGYIGRYYPNISVFVFDKTSKKLVWSGCVIAATSEPDIRLSTQVLLSDLFGRKEPNFPTFTGLAKRNDTRDGTLGFMPMIYTTDGNNFYPKIHTIAVGSPAYKQKLKPGDYITHIDKQSALNQSLIECLDALNKGKGESALLTIKRNNKVFDVTLIAEDEELAKHNWRQIIYLDEKWNIKKAKIPKVRR